jgi:CBS domain containing-hemolysin-like protein
LLVERHFASALLCLHPLPRLALHRVASPLLGFPSSRFTTLGFAFLPLPLLLPTAFFLSTLLFLPFAFLFPRSFLFAFPRSFLRELPLALQLFTSAIIGIATLFPGGCRGRLEKPTCED